MKYNVEFLPVATPMIKVGDDLVGIFLKHLQEQGIDVQDNDIWVIPSKVICVQEDRVIKFDEIKPSKKALALAKRFPLSQTSHPGRIETYLQEAEDIFGGVYYERPQFLALFTLKNGIVSGNAGVDLKNLQEGYGSLMPKDPQATANRLRREVHERTGKKIGVILSDSEFSPLRVGAIGLAVASSGFEPVRNFVGKPDLGGRIIVLARSNIADPIASMATLVCGEIGEHGIIPLVVARGVDCVFSEDASIAPLKLKPEEDAFSQVFKPTRKIYSWFDWDDHNGPKKRKKGRRKTSAKK